MKSCGCSGSLPCGCCAGTESVTPVSEFNRPGLSALTYRAGTHATFLETMEADLAGDRRLDGLTTRDTSDTSIAFLDAWATVGDVLTFYQERIANEGYLATATGRRSAMELGNLIGYKPRPGVSASVFLAYTLEKGATGTIGAGSLVRSSPNPGETQQAFETEEDLDADAQWNNLQVRLTQPSTKQSILKASSVYLQGLVTSVKKNDPLLVQFPDQQVSGQSERDILLCRVVAVEQDATAGRTRLGLEDWSKSGPFRLDTDPALADQLRGYLRIEEFGLSMSSSTVRSVVAILTGLVQKLDMGSDAGLQDGLSQIGTLGSSSRSTKISQWAQSISMVEKNLGVTPEPATPTTVDQIASQAGLLTAPSLAPRSPYNRASALGTLFDAPPAAKTISTQSEISTQLSGPPTQISGSALAVLAAFRPAFRDSLATALKNAQITPDPVIHVYSVIRTAAFGHNAGPQATTTRATANTGITAATTNADQFTTSFGEWALDSQDIPVAAGTVVPLLTKIDLDSEFDKVTKDTLVAIQQGNGVYLVPKTAPKVTTVARAAYGLSGKATRLDFNTEAVLVRGANDPSNLGFLRPVKVYLADAPLPLAEQPLTDPICGSDPEIELDDLYEGLTPGKWIIFDGEREDTTGTSGVEATELLLIGDVQNRASATLPGDRIHTFLQTVVPSSYCYKRATLKIYGNVVKASNGETRKEVLGSGDATVSFPTCPLKQPPLTFVAAPTATGAASTLKVYVERCGVARGRFACGPRPL